jgi:hypothetical protein
MSKLTNIYKFLYLEAGDKIYAGFDRENQFAIESQIFGMYDYLGQGIIEGWNIYWMGCTSNPYVMQQRQDLLNAYRTDRFSYLAIQYELLNLPTTESEWKQCVVVTSGLGIIEVFHAATEYPTFFRFGSVDHFYVWAQKNACTNTEYLCEIIAPLYPDEDYDLYNPAIYLGEVFTNTVSGNIEVTQISYSQRRRDLKNAQGDVQRMLSQALINHVHSGVDDMPSKINLNTRIIINVKIIENSNAFTFEYPENFNADLYSSIPQVYLDGVLLLPTQYQIINMVIFLQNNININSVLQIIYQVAPGPNIFITNDYQQTPLGTTGDNILTFSPPNDVMFRATYVINCAGINAVDLMEQSGKNASFKLIPFRGEYYKLKPEARRLCNTLIYPVPDPEMPFLGVHFTKTIDGGVECGPNAVLAFGKESQNIWDINWKELNELLVHVFESYDGGAHKFEHYSVASKTGTAQVAMDNGKGYYEDRHMHSFFGYFPAYDPKFLVFLFLKNPKEVKYASQTLIPPFISITKFLMNYYDVPPDR